MNQRTHLILIIPCVIILFALPSLIARFVYHHPNLIPMEKNNAGQLITPPVSIALFSIKNSAGQLLDNSPPSKNKLKPAENRTTNSKWMILLFNPGQCDTACLRKIYDMHQLWIATGKNQNRVERAVLTFQNFQQPSENTKILLITQKALSENKFTFIPGAFYLVDPMGNIMMVYQPNQDPVDILKDLQHLLMISQIG